jgi:hypothetical protein
LGGYDYLIAKMARDHTIVCSEKQEVQVGL